MIQNDSGIYDSWVLILGVVGLCILFVYLAWPISLILCSSAVAWWYLRSQSNSLGKAIGSVLFPISIGLGILSLILAFLNFNLLLFDFDLIGSAVTAEWITKIATFSIRVRDLLDKWHNLGLWTFPILVAALIAINNIFPSWKLVTRFLFLRAIMSSAITVLVIVTSVTFFGPGSFDQMSVDAKGRIEPRLKGVSENVVSKSFNIAVEQSGSPSRQFFEESFRRINEIVNRKYPFQSLLRDGKLDEARTVIREHLVLEMHDNLNAEFGGRRFNRNGQSRGDREKELLREIDANVETNFRESARLMTTLTEEFAERHVERVLDLVPIEISPRIRTEDKKTGKPEVNPWSQLEQETAGIKSMMFNTFASTIPEFEGIAKIFIEKVFEAVSERHVEAVATALVENRQKLPGTIAGLRQLTATLEPSTKSFNQYFTFEAWDTENGARSKQHSRAKETARTEIDNLPTQSVRKKGGRSSGYTSLLERIRGTSSRISGLTSRSRTVRR